MLIPPKQKFHSNSAAPLSFLKVHVLRSCLPHGHHMLFLPWVPLQLHRAPSSSIVKIRSLSIPSLQVGPCIYESGFSRTEATEYIVASNFPILAQLHSSAWTLGLSWAEPFFTVEEAVYMRKSLWENNCSFTAGTLGLDLEWGELASCLHSVVAKWG